jgi:hypothetical protein
MHGLLFNKWTQFGAQGLLGHKFHRAAEQVFEIELDTEMALRSCRAVECDQDVDVAIAARGVACGGAKQGKPRYPVTGR